jgi:hypothetical protein
MERCTFCLYSRAAEFLNFMHRNYNTSVVIEANAVMMNIVFVVHWLFGLIVMKTGTRLSSPIP